MKNKLEIEAIYIDIYINIRLHLFNPTCGKAQKFPSKRPKIGQNVFNIF